MTAIIAYAEPGYAFIAADSCRTVMSGIYYQAVKVYSWSEKVVFAQSGNVTQQLQMIYQMLAGRGVSYTHDMAGFECAWQTCQPHWQAIAASLNAHKSHIPIDGTILAADAASGEVKSFDFAKGSFSRAVPFGAAGCSNVHAAATAVWGTGRKDLDMWTVETISPLCAPNSGIDWPIDLMLHRSDGYVERTISTRLPTQPIVGRNDFLLP